DIASALTSITCLILLLRFWQPKSSWNLSEDPRKHVETAMPAEFVKPAHFAHRTVTAREAWSAWMPWIVLSIIVFLWGIPQVKNSLNHLSLYKFPIPYLNEVVFRMPPVVPAPRAEEAIFTL